MTSTEPLTEEPAAGAPPVIELREVTKKYDSGAPALASLSLRVSPGEALAVLGPSGSGKSTLLNLIAGLDRPSSGAVTVDGRRVDQMSETASAKFRRGRVGMVFQFFNLLDDLTVLDNVLLPAQLAGVPRAQARDRAVGLLRHLRIDRYAAAYPGRLSGGQRQRVAVARALVNRPALLLADEPTGALDTAAGEEVTALLAELNREGLTVVLVTHDVRLAEATATRVIELVDGAIVRDAAVGGATVRDTAVRDTAVRDTAVRDAAVGA
ncbi:ABC transporter [Frankia sp. CcI49]|uniref:ABC transporter ATP-binding protein n=1 Tax=Frankia sp. CcI49 TaxID=1745382 RepID=UPI00097790BB|nr:ABC transporter ATP-binding protein [Frankia sp. CcI49]ONH59917.1 ABC transporter [Frankia sp. CcI49]